MQEKSQAKWSKYCTLMCYATRVVTVDTRAISDAITGKVAKESLPIRPYHTCHLGQASRICRGMRLMEMHLEQDGQLLFCTKKCLYTTMAKRMHDRFKARLARSDQFAEQDTKIDVVADSRLRHLDIRGINHRWQITADCERSYSVN